MGPPPRGRDLVLATLAEHAPSLLATARRYSLCADDAQDAYQRGLEIFLKHADGVHAQGASAWLRTVIKHEALAVRAARLRLVGPVEADMDLEEDRHLADGDERAIAFERMERSAEALARLKPQEVRALVLKAHGYSYEEICAITGWTYTKVNRCLTEGRRALRERLDDIEAGRECDRWADVIAAVVAGEAATRDVAALRPHLRRCAACRAGLREQRMAQRGIAALVPLAALKPLPAGVEESPSLLVRMYEALAGGVQERMVASSQKVQAGVEAASAGKVAAVAASATALAGGGVAVVKHPVPAIGRAEAPAALKRADERRKSELGERERGSWPTRENQAAERRGRRQRRNEAPVARPRGGGDSSPGAAEPPAGASGSGEFAPGGSGSPPPPAPSTPAPHAVVSGGPGSSPRPAPSSSSEFGP